MALEAVVDAGAHQIGGEAHVGGRAAWHDAAASLAEIDIEIFDLGGPRSGDGRLKTAAAGPAGPGGGLAAERVRRRLDVAEGRAAGDVGHEAAEGIAEPATRGRQPRIAGFARCTETGAAAGAAADIAPGAVTLQAEHGLAHLVIITDGSADHGAGEIEAVRSVRVAPIRTAEAAAAVDADIEAGPIVRRLIDRRLGRHGGAARAVPGVC